MHQFLSGIPSIDHPTRSFVQDTLAFWEEAPWDAKARLVENGKIVNASDLGLGNKDRVDLIELMLRSEDTLPTECQAPPHASDRGVDAKCLAILLLGNSQFAPAGD